MSKFLLSAFADEAGESLQEQIAALKRNNITHMEIRAVDGVNVCLTPLDKIKEYKKQLDEAGIKIVTIGSPVGKVHLDEDYTEHLAMFLHTLAVAKILGATRIRMFSIFLPQDEDAAKYKELVMSRMAEMVKIAEGTGITLYHENEKDIYGDVPERVLELMDAFGGRMQFIFDPANYVQCDRDPLDVYPLLKDKIAYFHIKDARMDNKRVVPAGTGSGRIPQILKDYAQTHENTMLTLEPHLKAFAGLKDEVSIQYDEEAAYKDNAEAFDAGVAALKKILDEEGLSYE